MNEEKKEVFAAEIVRPAVGEPVAEAPPARAPLQPVPVTASAADAAPEAQKKPVEAPSPLVMNASEVRPPRRFSHARRAAVVATAIGLGWMGGWVTSGTDAASALQAGSVSQWLAASLGGSRVEPGEARQVLAEIQALKAGLDEVKGSLSRDRSENAQGLARIAERVEAAHRAERDSAAQLANVVQQAEQTSAAKLAGLAERFDRVERAGQDPTPRLTQIAERLDRMERQLTPAPAAAATVAKPLALAPNEPSQTSAVPENKPSTVENWALRDVYNGVALIEGKNRRLMEIVPGQNLPGVGRVEAIERRGKTWIVVTSRGIITSQAW